MLAYIYFSEGMITNDWVSRGVATMETKKTSMKTMQ